MSEELAADAHRQSHDPKVWCETHQHVHIARMPRFTFLCKDCGWGQWYGDQAREHELWTQENLREAHTTYEVEHVTRPLAPETSREAGWRHPEATYSPEVFMAMQELLNEAKGSPTHALRLAVSRRLSDRQRETSDSHEKATAPSTASETGRGGR